MPETRFHVEWPDGQQEVCYSPSTIIREYLQVGQHYTVPEFLDQVELGLNHASERVREKFGFYCSSAADQLARIRIRAATYGSTGNATVTIKKIY